MFHYEEHTAIVKSSDEDSIVLGKASLGIKNDLQKLKIILYLRKKNTEKSNSYKNTKVLDF